ncbi:MAG: NAD-dependent protein deacetylase [Myxococcota bacterium]
MKVTDRTDDIEELAETLRHLRVAVLTGAGCSTESGIPDYRGPKTREKTRNPIQYREFMKQPATRRRYWARSAIGWPRFCQARPNAAHEALAELERAGVVRGVITQNVDRLHHEAGSERIIELHGALAEVRCMACHHIHCRHEVQSRIEALNPGWTEQNVEVAPDGDAELPDGAPDGFQVPVCESCSGMLKPNVVFFGESVPNPVVDRAWRLMDEADALLVVGSSLAVYSGYRFVREAVKQRMPVAVLNLGSTRADDQAWVHVEAKAGEALPALARRLR